MVEQLSASGAAEILPLRRHQLDISQRAMARLEELARLMDCPLEVALNLAVANTLHTVQQSLAIYPRPLQEPAGDHKQGPDDV